MCHLRNVNTLHTEAERICCIVVWVALLLTSLVLKCQGVGSLVAIALAWNISLRLYKAVAYSLSDFSSTLESKQTHESCSSVRPPALTPHVPSLVLVFILASSTVNTVILKWRNKWCNDVHRMWRCSVDDVPGCPYSDISYQMQSHVPDDAVPDGGLQQQKKRKVWIVLAKTLLQVERK